MRESAAGCILCRKDELRTAQDRELRVCAVCAPLTGHVPMPPTRRRPAPCARCNHPKLVRVIPRELSVDAGVEQWNSPHHSVARNGPMFAAYELDRHSRTPFSGNLRVDVMPIDPRKGYGVLEAYICRGCGFVEWYCQNPAEIPIGPEYMTEEIDVVGDSPYR